MLSPIAPFFTLDTEPPTADEDTPAAFAFDATPEKDCVYFSAACSSSDAASLTEAYSGSLKAIVEARSSLCTLAKNEDYPDSDREDCDVYDPYTDDFEGDIAEDNADDDLCPSAGSPSKRLRTTEFTEEHYQCAFQAMFPEIAEN